jgi:hypothetical protein
MTTEEKFESCLEFLKMRMSESPEIRPKAKRLVWLDARENCSANISWPTFLNAWAAAKLAVPQAADAWSRAGAPQKSGQK